MNWIFVNLLYKYLLVDFRSKKIDLEPPVIDEEHVQKLGNIDINIKEQKAKMAAEIEAMSSQHEFDKKQLPKLPTDTHVVIAEKKCKQYETNNEGNVLLRVWRRGFVGFGYFGDI